LDSREAGGLVCGVTRQWVEIRGNDLWAGRFQKNRPASGSRCWRRL